MTSFGRRRIGLKSMKKYQVSPHFKFTCVILAISVCFWISYLLEMVRYHFPAQADANNLGILKNNQYVRVVAKECKSFPYSGKDGYTNSTLTNLSLTKDYKVYEFRLGEGAYLSVGVHDQNLQREVDSWPYGRGTKSVSILGKVIRSNNESLYIMQMTQEEVRVKYGILSMIGGIGLLVSFGMFFSFAGVRGVYVRPFEDSKRYKDYYLGRSYRMEEELEHEKRTLEELRQKQLAIKKSMKISGLVAGGSLLGSLGFGMLYVCSSSSIIPVGIMICSMYMSMILMLTFLWALKWFWQDFLNSDLPLAYRISDLFLLRTYSVRREESSKIIAVITNRLEKDREEKKKRQEETEAMLWYGPEGYKDADKNGGNAYESDIVK